MTSTITFTRKDLRPYAQNANVDDFTILDFHMPNTAILGFTNSIVFYDEETKITHNLR